MRWDFIRSIEFRSPLGPAAVAGAGRRPGRDHRAVLPQAPAAAGGGLEHASLAAEPRRPARQQPVPAAAAEPAAVPPTAGGRAGDAGAGWAADQGDQRPGAAVTSWRSTTRPACRRPTCRRAGWRRPRGGPQDRRRHGADDLAMVISFSDRPGSSRTTRATSAAAAADRRDRAVAGDDLAPRGAPGRRRAGEPVEAVRRGGRRDRGQVTPKLLIYTDGGFPDVEGFSLGNLEPEVVVIGPPPPALFASRRGRRPRPTPRPTARTRRTTWPSSPFKAAINDERPDVYQLFGRVHNYRAEPVKTEAQLFRHQLDKPGDDGRADRRRRAEIPARRPIRRSSSTCPRPGSRNWRSGSPVEDALAVDNRAFAVVGNTRKAQVLVVSAGNRYLLDAFNTPTAVDRADVQIVTPEEAKADDVAARRSAGPLRPGHLRRLAPRDAPRGQRPVFRRLPAGRGVRQRQGRRESGDPRLEHRPPDDAVHPRPRRSSTWPRRTSSSPRPGRPR